MDEPKFIIKYTATILRGDEYHPTGEKHEFSEFLLDKVKEYGLRLDIHGENLRKDLNIYHFYPVSILKTVYKLEPVDYETIPGGDRARFTTWGEEIGEDYSEKYPSHWTDHWC